MRADCPKGKLEFKFFSSPEIAITVQRQEISGCFPFVRTDRPDNSIKTIQLDQSNPSMNSMQEEDGFSAKALGKRLFHCQNDWSGHNPASSSDFWKAKSDMTTQTKNT